MYLYWLLLVSRIWCQEVWTLPWGHLSLWVDSQLSSTEWKAARPGTWTAISMSITSAHGVLPSSATVTIRCGGVFLINVQFHNQFQIIWLKVPLFSRLSNEILVELEVFSLNLVLIREPLYLKYSKKLSRLWTNPKRGSWQSLLGKTGCFLQNLSFWLLFFLSLLVSLCQNWGLRTHAM